MADVEKKARLSGEQPRAAEPATLLPTTNPATEKPAPPPPSLHPAVYVVYVEALFSLSLPTDSQTAPGSASVEA